MSDNGLGRKRQKNFTSLISKENREACFKFTSEHINNGQKTFSDKNSVILVFLMVFVGSKTNHDGENM
jgi:hypothetical protein